MSDEKQTILIIDEESDFLEWADRHLSNDVVEVITTASVAKLGDLLDKHRPDLIIAELHLTPLSGMEILKRIRQADPNAMMILTTGFPPSNAVIEAMKLGAYDFLRKESLAFDLRPVVESALKAVDEMRSTTAVEVDDKNIGFKLAEQSIIANSAAMQDVFKMVGRVSRSDAPVLITGESGCGKELVSRAIHQFSPRSKQEFVAINCAAIPDNLLESELFGHEKGAFTGAHSMRVGRFEQCDGGSLFLDEIGDMPMQVQSKILRVLQEGEFSRVGGNETLRTDVRIVAATNKHLEAEVEKSHFREDLFYRLNVFRVHIPPLRQRPEDIRILADFFLEKIGAKKNAPRLRISEEAYLHLEKYNWPGNVRELENTMQRASVLSTADVLLPRDFPLGDTTASLDKPALTVAAADVPAAPDSIDAAVAVLIAAAEADPDLQLLPWLERTMTAYAMKKTGSNQVQAAKLLGITRATLRKRVERLEEDAK